MTPLFAGAFLLMMVLARMSEKKGEGEVPFVLGPSNDLALSPEEEAFPLMDPTKKSERETEEDPWTQTDPVPFPFERVPKRCGASIVREHQLIQNRFWVYTHSGEYLFHDLETALAFAQPDEVVMLEDGTVYGGKPDIFNTKIVDCIAKNFTGESGLPVRTSRPVIMVEKNVPEIVLW